MIYYIFVKCLRCAIARGVCTFNLKTYKNQDLYKLSKNIIYTVIFNCAYTGYGI